MALNSDLPRSFAALYACAGGTFVPNGTSAVEATLRLMDLPRASLVAVPSWCCWKVASAVESAGHEVVEFAYDENLQPHTDAVDPRIRSAVAVAILVHYAGWPCSFSRLRAAFAQARIVEDCAQAWRLRRDGRQMGEGADLAITSLGAGKALDLGLGGAVFYHDESLGARFDMAAWPHARAPIPFSMPAPQPRALADAMRQADQRLGQRRERAQFAARHLEQLGARPLNCPDGSDPTWMRLPVVCKSNSELTDLAAELGRAGVVYQRPWRRRAAEGESGTRWSEIPLLMVDIREPHPWWSRRDRASRSDQSA